MLFKSITIASVLAAYVVAATVDLPDVDALISEYAGDDDDDADYSDLAAYSSDLASYSSDFESYYSDFAKYYTESGDDYSEAGDDLDLDDVSGDDDSADDDSGDDDSSDDDLNSFYSDADNFFTRSDVLLDISSYENLGSDWNAYTKWYVSFNSKYRSQLNSIYSAEGDSNFDALSDALEFASLYGTRSVPSFVVPTASQTGSAAPSTAKAAVPKLTSGTTSNSTSASSVRITAAPSSGNVRKAGKAASGSSTLSSSKISSSAHAKAGSKSSSSSRAAAGTTGPLLAVGAILGGFPFFLF